MSDTRDVPDDARVEDLAILIRHLEVHRRAGEGDRGVGVYFLVPQLDAYLAALRELLTLRAKLARIRREGAWPEPSIAGGKSPLRATVEPAGFVKSDPVWAGEHAKPWDGKMDPERTTYWSEVGNDYRDVRWLPGLDSTRHGYEPPLIEWNETLKAISDAARAYVEAHRVANWWFRSDLEHGPYFGRDDSERARRRRDIAFRKLIAAVGKPEPAAPDLERGEELELTPDKEWDGTVRVRATAAEPEDGATYSPHPDDVAPGDWPVTSLGERKDRVLSAVQSLPEAWAVERLRVELPYLLRRLSAPQSREDGERTP